jgi:PHD/YefM family antitoxin component YafN of YafNO toxin-antitoxin module
MCDDDLQRIEDLPQRAASDIKRRPTDLMRQVRASGVVAITHRGKVEMIMMDAPLYRRMAALSGDEKDVHRAASLEELSAEFDRRLASLKSPDARDRIDAVMNARGRSKRRPKAGESF